MNNEFKPNYAVPPAETIKEMMDDKEWTVKDLSILSLLSEETIKGVLSADVEINEHIAFQFEKALGISRTFWLNLERNYRNTIKRLEAEGKKLKREEGGFVYEVD
ncbi:plasmid maintenance system antidote protein, XRE family [Bacillus sp. M6-12]|uniref:helix-turn-helix transcriptional regulator n=1 Tax=Bacillus sp. M6-12 TaxID=2054166 RepID=UPI000C76157E|nr:plasmid maintenance system antidote protein, XRE family [Bacillus sp. M6-12]PLS19155.1 plasmid maintenance system antidote protein, XRE family [Bacillus sp. M6-12]